MKYYHVFFLCIFKTSRWYPVPGSAPSHTRLLRPRSKVQYNPSNKATLGTKLNGPIWGVALIEGWAIPDAIKIGVKKTPRKPLKIEHLKYV